MSIEESKQTKILLEKAKQKTMELNNNDSSGSKKLRFPSEGTSKGLNDSKGEDHISN